jgi:hypothetical protein
MSKPREGVTLTKTRGRRAVLANQRTSTMKWVSGPCLRCLRKCSRINAGPSARPGCVPPVTCKSQHLNSERAISAQVVEGCNVGLLFWKMGADSRFCVKEMETLMNQKYEVIGRRFTFHADLRLYPTTHHATLCDMSKRPTKAHLRDTLAGHSSVEWKRNNCNSNCPGSPGYQSRYLTETVSCRPWRFSNPYTCLCRP